MQNAFWVEVAALKIVINIFLWAPARGAPAGFYYDCRATLAVSRVSIRCACHSISKIGISICTVHIK
jgi:hypothetical protein